MKIVGAMVAMVVSVGVAGAQTAPATQSAKGPGTKVTFREDGIALVNGKPFFPIGIWVYEINTNVLGDIHEHQFNTVIGNGFTPGHLDSLFDHGLMGVPIVTEEFVQRGMKHPALLAWYLTDEPEGRKKPEEVKKDYEALKARDPDHPIGTDHYLFEALKQYVGCSDFTMTDVYPILASRDGIITNVGLFIDEARKHRNANWPHWVFIQIFGGPDSDGGKWAQPLPGEVRCMTFIALVHRAGGINYFSYWPKAPTTWDSVTKLNKDLHRIEPWLLAVGEEKKAEASSKAVQIRAKKVREGWLIIAVNTSVKFETAELSVEGIGDATLSMAFESREVKAPGGKWMERFGPLEEKVYVVGEEPAVQ